ncbi:hypothetical protein BD560DRAFT_141078 [Blakeslea trispora]|nr:hypothetical protein BD560DRAFT_141078 [Blakeslea trispora]
MPVRPVWKIYIELAEDVMERSIHIDMAWCRRIWTLATRAHLVSVTGVYYSVLGGAFCSLGKDNKQYAYKASVLAIEQIKLAKKLKDPILECKCWLYFAEDLIQLGRLDRAENIIIRQKPFISSMNDFILSSMFEAVQEKLELGKK